MSDSTLVIGRSIRYRQAMCRSFCAALLVLVFLGSISEAAESPGPVVALKAARLFDGKANALVPNGVVVVQDGKIVDAGANVAVPDGAQVIDLGDATLSPGFIDSHTHLTADYSRPYNRAPTGRAGNEFAARCVGGDSVRASARWRRALPRCAIWARATLSMWPCAMRSRRISCAGPRMLVATKGVGATGGHFDDTNAFRDRLFGREPDYTDGIVDGPEEIRKAVRYEVKNGADVIKGSVSGGVLSMKDEVDVPQLAPDEIAMLVSGDASVAQESWRCIATATRRRGMRSMPGWIRSSTARF